jgi:arsenite methyltransferase
METALSNEDKRKIEDSVRLRYSKAAQNPEGRFRYPTGKAGLEALGYDRSILGVLPDEVLATYCGVGQPFSLGRIESGEGCWTSAAAPA